jgi:hypothetical protein
LARILQQQVDRTDVLIHFLAELVVAVEQHRDQRTAPRHHDCDVQAAVLVGGRVNRSPHLCGHEGVARGPVDGEALLGQAGGGVTQLPLGASGQRDVRAIPGEEPGRPKADATPSTDHDGPLSTQNLLHCTPSR